MPSSALSSASSSSSSSRSSSLEPQPKSKALKRKHQEQEAQSSSDSSSDDSDFSSDSESKSEEETDKKASKKATEAKPSTENPEPVEAEEPVLSHAERRRQKRLAKQKAAEAADDSEGVSKKRKLADGSAAADAKGDKDKPKPRQNSVWVGNMSFKTTQDDLKRFFGECGEITRVNMPTKPKTRPNVPVENRGFVHFLALLFRFVYSLFRSYGMPIYPFSPDS